MGRAVSGHLRGRGGLQGAVRQTALDVFYSSCEMESRDRTRIIGFPPDRLQR